MNKLSQQKRLDWAEHGMNCSDDLCVLPVCINWKAFRQAIARQNGRQTQDMHTRSKDANQHKSGLVRGHINDEQFLQFQREVQEFERVQFNISEYLAVKPNVNPLQVYQAVDKVGSQQVSQVTSYGPMQDIEKPTIPNFDLEQFVSIDSFVVPPEKKEDIKNDKCPQNDHADIQTEFPVGPSVLKETVCSQKESKEQLQGIQAKGTNKIFGILSEILHVLEAPMSAELEAFCIQVLQKAHKDIQNKSLLMSSPTMCPWETSELDIFYHQ